MSKKRKRVGGGPVRKEKRVPARATREEVLVRRGAVIRKREGTDLTSFHLQRESLSLLSHQNF